MAEALQSYIVTPKAGEFVAGSLSAGAGTVIRLTEAQARYELLIGSIVPDGTPVTIDPPAGPISANDRLDLTRGSKAWDASVGELLAFLLTRILPEVTETLGDVEGRIVGGAGLSDNTLGKLATRIATLADATRNDLDARAPLRSPALLDLPTAPTAALGTNSQQLATTAFVAADLAALANVLQPAIDSKAPLASPPLAGVPTAPTAMPGTASKQLATTEFVAAALVALGLGSAATLTAGGGPGNVPVLDAGGKLLANILPALAITDTFEVASQAAMLALAAERGDVAVRSDLSRSFILKAEPASTLANWVELKTPTDAVLAVAGLTGTITAAQLRVALALATADVSGLDLALGNRLRVDAAQGLTPAQIAQALTNLGLGAAAGALTIQSLRTTGAGDNDYRQAQAAMSGGGVVSWAGLRLKWTKRFLYLPIAAASSPDGYVQATMPTVSIPAAQVYSGVARSVTTDGVSLGDYEALYVEHTVGGAATAMKYRIVRYDASFVAPPNWLLLAAYNAEDGTLKLGNGQFLRSGQSRDFSTKEAYDIAEVTGLVAALAAKRSVVNHLINGAFEIWQRGTTRTAGIAADNFFTNANSGVTTFERYAVPAAFRGVTASKYGMRMRCSDLDTSKVDLFIVTGQHTEDVRVLAGKRVCIGMKALRLIAGSTHLGIAVYQTFGSGGSPSARRLVYSGQIALPAVNAMEERFVFADIPDVADQTIGTDKPGTTEFHVYPAVGSGYSGAGGMGNVGRNPFDLVVTDLQVAVTPLPITAAPPFERVSVGEDLSRCMRYFQRGALSILGGAYAADCILSASVRLPVEMYAKPTMTLTPFYEVLVKTRACDSYDERSFRAFISATQAAGNVECSGEWTATAGI